MQQAETALGQWLKKRQSLGASTSTLRASYTDEDLSILKAALGHERVTLLPGVLEHPLTQFDIQSFINSYKICSNCHDAALCMSKTKGYCMTLTNDGKALMRPCNKYANYRRAFKQLIMTNGAQIPIGYKQMTFDNLDQSGNQRAVEYAKGLAINATDKGMFLYGETGCGKTHLAVATLQEWIKHDDGMFFTLPNLFSVLKDSIGDKQKLDDVLSKLLETKLLVLDDMGAEKFSEWVGEQMFRIINDRLINQRKLIVTSNFSMEALEERMGLHGARIMSRIAGMCTVFKVTGRDRRLD